MKAIAPALLLLLCLPSCMTRKQMASRPLDLGMKAVYDAPFEKVRRAALDAVAELAFDVKKEGWEDERRYMILSSQGVRADTMGRYARVVIEKGEGECVVYVLVDSKAGNEDTRAVEDAIGHDLQKRIGRRAGGP